MNKQEYERYLASLHWKAVRLRKLADIPFCEYCGCRVRLEVHHSSYEHLGHERLDEDLIVLCRDCHQEEHDELPTKYEKGLATFAYNKYHRDLDDLDDLEQDYVEEKFRAWIGIYDRD